MRRTIAKEEHYDVALTRDTQTGIVMRETWSVQATPDSISLKHFHRTDGPAVIRRDPSTGIPFLEMWYVNGVHHRNGAPAIIRHDPATGTVITEKWYEYGQLHRIDGPAVITRDPLTGREISKWWREGEPLTGSKRPRKSRAQSPAPV